MAHSARVRPAAALRFVTLSSAAEPGAQLPPDILLLALCLAKPEKSFQYALWCTLGSVIGGVVGWLLGLGLWTGLEPYMIPKIFSQAKFDRFDTVRRGSLRPLSRVSRWRPYPRRTCRKRRRQGSK